ncbi:MAG: MBL fold metallo-hydrolase [Chloroflexi bacterium]|nr:MBL fold metallo-hydrolase [Chloroflexota bacterium]
MEQLAPGVYVETGFKGVTVGAIVDDDGIICVDAPLAPAEAHLWVHKLADLSPAPIRFVINLDHHLDRLLGNPWLEAPSIANEFAAEHIHDYPEVFRGQFPASGAVYERVEDLAGTRIVPPQLTFTDRLTLERPGRRIELLRVSGPNSGAIWVHLPAERIVFVGDCVVLNTPPFLAGAQPDDWLEAGTSGLSRLAKYIRDTRRKVTRQYERGYARAHLDTLLPDLLAYWEVPRADHGWMAPRLMAGLDRLRDLAERDALARERL